MLLRDSLSDLRIEATIPETTIGNDALELVRGRVLRGLSIEFIPSETRREGDKRMGYTTVIEKSRIARHRVGGSTGLCAIQNQST